MTTAVYVHVPVCTSKCIYCDFTSDPCFMGRKDEVVRALHRQINTLVPRLFPEKDLVHSIYIGGGTPSALGNHLVGLADNISRATKHTETIIHSEVEFTVEVNPGSISKSVALALVERSVTRFSVGVQSFDDDELQALGRTHSSRKARTVVKMLAHARARVSIDLIAGIPGQTMETWRSSLAQALALPVGHISIYPLTVEEGTPLALRVEEGSIELPVEDEVADMLEEASRVLSQAGFTRYEVSNYAKPGEESQHNLAYWSGVPYLGIGPSAASMFNTPTGRVRLSWPDDIETYLQKPLSPPVSLERLTKGQRTREDLMLGLRRSSGVTLDQVDRACSVVPELRRTIDELIGHGLLITSETHLAIPESKWLLSNEVFSAIWCDL